ncbi:unnamed protein product [Prunus armeniaca]
MISKFWWKNSECSKGISWAKKWMHLCFAKDEGGMGFRDLEAFNKALVAKQSGKGRASSYIWRSLISGCELLFSGLRKRIGDGKETLVYGDPWIPRPNSFRPISPQVLDQETKEDVNAITSIPLSVNHHKDRWMWHYTTNGIFSVKSGYRLEMSKKKDCSGAGGSSSEPRVRNAFWRKVWSQEI